MITLFIDSSRKDLSVVLAKSDEIIYTSNINSFYRHSNFLMKEIVCALNKNSLKISDIDNIVVLNGPGSFTGVRVGVTVSKTLAWALNKKIYTLSTLKALSLQANEKTVISVISDKRNSGYVGVYCNDNNFEKYLDLSSIKDIVIDKKVTIVCFNNDDFVKSVYDLLLKTNNVSLKIIDEYDYLKVINYALNNTPLNPHLVKPVYIKQIDAEKKSV